MTQIQVLFGLLFTLAFYNLSANASGMKNVSIDQYRVISVVKKTESYIKKNGIKKAIIAFKDSNDIFIANYNGMFFVSPLHPELIGKNQFNYKDPSGALVVQEEINKAKTGGGWLKVRVRKDSVTGKYQCRKIYILPVSGNYYIGSWYHYSPSKYGICFENQSIVNKIVGTWKLVSVTHVQLPSGMEVEDYGSHPKGYLQYSPDGHVMILMVQGNRIKPQGSVVSPVIAAMLFKSMTSYAGTYQIKDDKIIHHIDISWNEMWSGTKQVRYYKLIGNRLTLTMAPFIDPKYGKIVVHLVWERD